MEVINIISILNICPVKIEKVKPRLFQSMFRLIIIIKNYDWYNSFQKKFVVELRFLEQFNKKLKVNTRND